MRRCIRLLSVERVGTKKTCRLEYRHAQCDVYLYAAVIPNKPQSLLRNASGVAGRAVVWGWRSGRTSEQGCQNQKSARDLICFSFRQKNRMIYQNVCG
jgi:hypothetical protein